MMRFHDETDRIISVWPVFPPLAVLGCGFFVFNKFVEATVPIEVPDWSTASVMGGEATRRFMVSTILFLLIVSCAVGVAVSLWVIWKRITFWSGVRRLAVAAVALLTCYWIFGDGHHFYGQLGTDLFARTIGAFPTRDAPAGGLPLLDWIITIGNYAAIVAGIFIGIAMTTLPPAVSSRPGADAAPRSQEAVNAAARKLAEGVRDLKHLLFNVQEPPDQPLPDPTTQTKAFANPFYAAWVQSIDIHHLLKCEDLVSTGVPVVSLLEDVIHFCARRS